MKESLKILKIGGNVINDPIALEEFLFHFAQIPSKKILIHGGGKKASEMAEELGLEPKMVNGRRITDLATLEIVTMVYAGLLNKNIVANLQKNQCNAIGLSGADGNCILAHKRVVKEIDYGFAGDVDSIDVKTISALLNSQLTPVFCAITHDKNGQLLNTNADTIASELSIGLSEKYDVELIYCFEKNGVLRDVNDNHSVIEKINKPYFEALKKDRIVAEGMLPKLENCFAALEKGVQKVTIGSPNVFYETKQKCTTLIL
ncbi:acetylglutamate kinase [Namhaeicola litoreus]|uniref:Acetylglutamate kinase n=1 Tax=Namhaeicola litoreus TaxID=1052145 RepID=A0ABW3Y225_9FLAO